MAGDLTTVPDGTVDSDDLGDDVVFDARAWSHTGDLSYPVGVGAVNRVARQAWIGGTVIGTFSDALTWQQMKADHDGTGPLLYSEEWTILAGVHCRNVMDGLRPRGADIGRDENFQNMRIEHCLLENIRDDAIENDRVRGGLIRDVMADGCFTFLSQQNGTWDGTNKLHVIDCLARLEAFAYSGGPEHGNVIKTVSTIGVPTYFRNCLFVVPQAPVGNANFPPWAKFDRCVLVWLGGGDYPGRLPPAGLTVSTDPDVWGVASANWRSRHGVVGDSIDYGLMLNPSAAPLVTSFL